MSEKKRFLNVGGNDRRIPVPDFLQGWEHLLLDIDPAVKPDILCDARQLETQDMGVFDAVYCSHNLEHYYKRDVPKVLKGFRHILKPDGFAFIRVPELLEVMRKVVADNLELDDTLYESKAGPILVSDVLYGWSAQMEHSNNDFFAHKTGFSQQLLKQTLAKNGFPFVFSRIGHFEVQAFAFLRRPEPETLQRLGLPIVP